MSDDRARLRDVAAQLRAYGLVTPEKVLRLAAVAMTERVLAWARERDASPSLVARVLLDGGVIFEEQRPRSRRQSPSDLLATLREAREAQERAA